MVGNLWKFIDLTQFIMLDDSVTDFRSVIEEKLKLKKTALDETEQHLKKFFDNISWNLPICYTRASSAPLDQKSLKLELTIPDKTTLCQVHSMYHRIASKEWVWHLRNEQAAGKGFSLWWGLSGVVLNRFDQEYLFLYHITMQTHFSFFLHV